MPILIQKSDSNFEKRVLSISRQLLISRDTNSQRLWNIIDWEVNKLIMFNVAIYNPTMLDNSVIMMKLRVINLKSKQIKMDKINELNLNKPHFLDSLDKVNYHNINYSNKMLNGHIIPLTMNLDMYGSLLQTNNDLFTKFNLDNTKPLYKLSDNYQLYLYKQSTLNNLLTNQWTLFKDGHKYLSFKDTQNDPFSLNKFTRTIDDIIINSENMKIKFMKTKLNSKFIEPLQKSLINRLNIVTFDIETYVGDNGLFVPYACAWYNGKMTKTYYLTDFNSSTEMLLMAINELIELNSKSVVYVHNLSNFDYIFLSKLLFTHFNVKPLFKNNDIISLEITTKENKAKITMYDRFLILPNSLRSLAIKYNVSESAGQKGLFPYSFVNKDNLDYNGQLPNFNHYKETGLTEMEHNDLILLYDNNKDWNLRDETILYLESDLKSLYEVINKFAQDIYSSELVDISKCPTNSSVSFRIFRTNYLKNSKLPIVKGTAHNNMRKGYYGGYSRSIS